MKIEMSWKLTKLSKWLLVALATIILVLGGVYGYFYKYKNGPHGSQSNSNKSYDLALYSIVQNDKAKLVAYDPKTTKNFELFSIDWKDKNTSFYADYNSSNGSIAYSDENGISIYDLASKKTTKILSNVKPANADEPGGTYYVSPKWSKNYKKIVYKKLGYESMSYELMDPDGKNIQAIEGEGYSFAWKPDGSQYAIGSSAGLGTGAGINVSLSDPITKTKQALPTSELRDIDSIVWGDKLYFSGAKQTACASDGCVYEIVSANPDGTDVKVIDKDDYDNKGLAIDTDGKLYYTKYVHKIVDNIAKSAGIYTINSNGEDKQLFYQDGDKQLIVQGISNEFVAIQSTTNSWSQEATRSLLLVNKSDKKAVLIGEAVKINFTGFIRSNKLPGSLTELKAPEPTEAEKIAYADSLKSHGYLYKTFYDYCWDFNCELSTFPYDKKSVSSTPEIITMSQSPIKLTGTVNIPVVYYYIDRPFTDEQLNILNDDATSLDSFARVSKWLNDQGKAVGKNFTVNFDYKGQEKVNESCIKYSGSNKVYDEKCIRTDAETKYPGIASSPLIVTMMANINIYTSAMNYQVGDDKNILIINANYSSSIDNIQNSSYYPEDKKAEEIRKIFYTYNYIAWDYRIKNLLTLFGAKVKNATYKTPKTESSPACFVGDTSDVMCDRNVNSDGQPIKKFDEKIIGDTTWKELGWYDADGDGAMEVSDKCPFNKANKC